jgi:hypothetical protein
MVEFWKYANLSEELVTLVKKDGGLVTAHSAEGPGGFLEAIAVMTKRIGWTYTACHAMTLRSTTKHVPGWRKAATFLETHPMVHISYGADDTGDILKKENRTQFIHECKRAHLYTADGGFDFSGDYHGQEDSIFSLLVAECLIGIQVLQKGGVMIIKCFDTTEKQTLDLLWMVCSLFREWRFMKPRTSRSGNAERYFIGIGFLGEEAGVKELVTLAETVPIPFLKNTYPKEWLQTLWEVQEAIEREEYRIIRETIGLIREEHSNSSHLRALVRQNVVRSIEWCKEHGESISTEWTSHLDRYVAQEVIDLLQILKPAPPPPPPTRIPSWTVRPERVPTERMFDGFRSVLTIEPAPAASAPAPKSCSSFHPSTGESLLTEGSSKEEGNRGATAITSSQRAADRSGTAASVSSLLISPPALREGNVPTEGSSKEEGNRGSAAITSSQRAEASQTDPPERFPRGQRRYVDLFSRPRRTPTVESSSPTSLRGTSV